MPETLPRIGISLLRARPELWPAIAVEAEALGYESVWMSDHLVLPTDLDSAAYPNTKLPINPTTPVFDTMVHLASLAAITTTLRLGTYVYLLALRPPFVAARSVATLDHLSGGRVELGVGTGWSAAEWAAAGLDYGSRGRRLDEALEVCRRLWTEPAVEHRGEFYDFPEVAFEPKPPQRPHPPVHIGGESPAALRRALKWDGWIGMHHTPESAAPILGRVRSHVPDSGRDAPLRLTVATEAGAERRLEDWQRLGVDRLIVAPWSRSSEALQGLRDFAAYAGLVPPAPVG